jgi:hypothetical protein
MYHDPELPGGFQDADIEMAALSSIARRIQNFRQC